MQAALLLVALGLWAAVAVVAPPNRDPDAARLVTEDVARFWQAWDAAAKSGTREQRAEVFRRGYLEPGTPGLAAFTRLRIGNADNLVATMDAHPRYYASLRGQAALLETQKPKIRETFRRMAAIYPDAMFPDVYFLVGRMNSGGTLDSSGLLIGLEMYGRSAETPLDELGPWHRRVIGNIEMLPHIVAHEWVHFQQRYPEAEQPTLLQAAMVEGVADFIAELGSGRHINHHVHAWAEPRAAALWTEFREAMHRRNLQGWLYGGDQGGDRPADVGYWMGYRIARAYYARAADKTQAVRDMLTIQDFDAFLAASGVAAEFEDARREADPAAAR